MSLTLNSSKMKNFYNTRDSYTVYKTISEDPIDIRQYITIVNEFMKFLMQRLFDTGLITFPERLGTLQIIGKKVKFKIEDGKIKGLAPDWLKTKELWENDLKAKEEKQLVYFFNEHSNGIRYKFLWSKNRVLVSNKTLYNLKLSRANKRTLTPLINSGKEYLIKN